MSSGRPAPAGAAARKPRSDRPSNEKTARKSKENMSSKVSRQSAAGRGIRSTANGDTKWNVTGNWAPPRRLTDSELKAARTMFFQLDTDGSGSIDAEELGVMMRSLGQNPTDDELKELIDSVDSGDKDGKIQLREFLTLYSEGLDTRAKPGAADVNNVFLAVGGDPREKEAKIDSNELQDLMLAQYDLKVSLADTFGVGGDKISKDDMQGMLLDAEELLAAKR